MDISFDNQKDAYDCFVALLIAGRAANLKNDEKGTYTIVCAD
jgi:hypothetical protein